MRSDGGFDRETFSGLLVLLLWRKLDTQIRKGFEAMNHA
jgi:hypothetical protein